jgi:Kelch motif
MIGTLGCYLWPLLISLLCSCNPVGSEKPSVPAESSVTPAASMNAPRSGQTATLLPTGQVLIAGGMNGNDTYFETTEIYDPAANRFVGTMSMSSRRIGHSATLLASGKVLVAGGFDGEYLQTAELYDPLTRRFTPTGRLTIPRSEHIAVLLKNGKVLLVGGVGSGYSFLASCEVYDPATGAFSATGSMNTPREGHTATLLQNGKVLVTGGHKDRQEVMTVHSSAELYDPATGKFTATGNMSVVRHKHGAALLRDGNVLIVGGSDKRDRQGQYASAEIYDQAKGVFRPIASMSFARYKLTSAVVVLKNGKVLVAGGSEHVEVFDPTTSTFRKVEGQMDTPRFFSSATLLQDGRVLITGGYDGRGSATVKAWLSDVGK